MAGHPPYEATSRTPRFDSLEDLRTHRKRTCAIGYRMFGALGWGQLGDGHISARDPEHIDHFWMLRYGVSFKHATVADLVLVSPEGRVVEGQGPINMAAYYIHHPVHEARPDVVAAAHCHTPYGTPFSAQNRLFEPLNQESAGFVFNQSLFDDEEVAVASTAGGERIAEAIGTAGFCVLRNHGLLTAADSVESAVAEFIVAERVAEVHIKAGDSAVPLSEEGAKVAAATYDAIDVSWHWFQWLVRDLVPDPTVVD